MTSKTVISILKAKMDSASKQIEVYQDAVDHHTDELQRVTEGLEHHQTLYKELQEAIKKLED